MSYIQRLPFIRILMPFVAGIILESWFGILNGTILVIILLSVLSAIFFFSRRYRYHTEFVGGLLFSFFFLISGIWIAKEKNRVRSLAEADHYLATVLERPVEKQKSLKADAVVTLLHKGDSVIRSSEKLIIYFEKSAKAGDLAPGSSIIFDQVPVLIENSIPSSFHLL